MMNFRHILVLVALALGSLLSLEAQTGLPQTSIGGIAFYYYETSAGESIYDIAAKLGITKDDIIRNNPDAADGIEPGTRLYFPVHPDEVITPTTTSSVTPSTTPSREHLVQQGETLYGLAKRYGVTVDELISANPGSDKGIKIGQRLAIPDAKSMTSSGTQNASSQTTAAQGGTPVIHAIKNGEDIYSIAKMYNCSIEGILMANPGIKPDEYVPGTSVKVVPGTALPFTYERTTRRNYKHEVQRGETFASIAAANGITEKELKEANPDMKKAKKGKTIVLPKPYNERVTGEMATIPVEELRAWYEPRINEMYTNLVDKRLENEVNIAMILPFQLHKSAPPRQAYLYTDFYKGFLLALDSVNHLTDKHINLKIYDTQHNLNVTDSILALAELKGMNIIIAPSEPQQLARINAFGKANAIPVMNCFTTKNEDYLDNPYVYQVNPPTNEMMHDVLTWFDKRFNGYNVVYLVAASENDKEMFEHIRKHINGKKYHVTTINVNGDLTYNDISNKMDPGSKYVFIPSSGDKSLIKRYISALKEVKKERFDCDMGLIAYPEYVLYLKDYQTDLQDIDTYMFTRFFNSKGFRTRDFETAYKANFSGEPLQGVPNMAIMGYDTGMYLIKSLGIDGLISEDTPMYRGIQTSYRWQRGDNWRGMTNQAIEIVHFSTDHQITVNVQ